MRYVLDSNVALKVVLPEVDSSRAIRLLAEHASGLHELIAPTFFTSEVANALVSAERQGRLSPGESMLRLQDVLLNAPQFVATDSLLVRAMAMALATRHAVYDCLYVALAERESCDLVTADDKLVKALRPTFPFITLLAALP
jgi:predicted nucleic acid-binding protein